MPDNKKQGRSNKTMTFFVCFLAALAGLLFGLESGALGHGRCITRQRWLRFRHGELTTIS